MLDEKVTLTIRNRNVKELALHYISEIVPDDDNPWCVEIKPRTRTLDQNAKLWAMLQDISKQVTWYGRKLTKEQWKHIFTASLKGQQTVPGLDGEFVVCGYPTSNMSKRLFSDMIELMYAFGNEQKVDWGECAKEVYEEMQSMR